MAPVEIFKGERVDPEKLEDLEGKNVFGIIYYSSEREVSSLQELRDHLRKLLATDPKGFIYSEMNKNLWASRRKEHIGLYGDEALINLFPKKWHRGYSAFLLPLIRDKIYTVSQLKEQEDGLYRIRGFNPESKKMMAARLIIGYSEKIKRLNLGA